MSLVKGINQLVKQLSIVVITPNNISRWSKDLGGSLANVEESRNNAKQHVVGQRKQFKIDLIGLLESCNNAKQHVVGQRWCNRDVLEKFFDRRNNAKQHVVGQRHVVTLNGECTRKLVVLTPNNICRWSKKRHARRTIGSRGIRMP